MDEKDWKRIFIDTMKAQGGHAPAVAEEEAEFQWAHLPSGQEPNPEEHAMRIARSYQP